MPTIHISVSFTMSKGRTYLLRPLLRMVHVIANFTCLLPPAALYTIPQSPSTLQRIVDNPSSLSDFILPDITCIIIPVPRFKTTHIRVDETSEFLGLDEFTVGMCSRSHKAEDIFGKSDSEQLRKGCS